MKLIENLDTEIAKCLNSEEYDDNLIARLANLTTIKFNLGQLEQKKAIDNIFDSLMSKASSVNLADLVKESIKSKEVI